MFGLDQGCFFPSHLGHDVSEVRPHLGFVHPDALFRFGLVSFRAFGPSPDEGFSYVGQKFFPLVVVRTFRKAVDEVSDLGGVHGLFIVFRLWWRPRFARSFLGRLLVDVVGAVDVVVLVNRWLYVFFVRLLQLV